MAVHWTLLRKPGGCTLRSILIRASHVSMSLYHARSAHSLIKKLSARLFCANSEDRKGFFCNVFLVDKPSQRVSDAVKTDPYPKLQTRTFNVSTHSRPHARLTREYFCSTNVQSIPQYFCYCSKCSHNSNKDVNKYTCVQHKISHQHRIKKCVFHNCSSIPIHLLFKKRFGVLPPYTSRLYHSSMLTFAGHNKWSKVKHKKKATDLEKSKTIHKYVTLIVSAVKTGGGTDPDSNFRLASVIESARKSDVPKANVENAIKIASSKRAHSTTELVVYDARGPSGYHIIIEAFTDNNRKTRPEIKNLLAKYSAILGEPGSSSFMFDRKGVINVPACEIDPSTDLLEVAIEAGAEDVQSDYISDTNVDEDPTSNSDSTSEPPTGDQRYVKFICNSSELTAVSKALQSLGYTVATANLEYLPKSFVSLNKESYESALKLLYALSEHSNVTEVYDNITLESDV